MRMFWIVVLALTAVAGVVIWRSSGNGSADSSTSKTRLATDAAPANDAPSLGANASERAGERAAEPAKPAASGNPTPVTPPAPADDLSPFGTHPPAVLPSKRDADSSSSSLSSSKDAAAAALAADLIDSSGKARAAADEQLADELSEGEAEPDAAVPGKAGAVDGKYIVSGDGSAEHPYEITWDLLILASQTYQPRIGKTEVPPKVQAIDGKRIKITGYFAFPVASTDPHELLMMLNMWDGCCIGVPPSPYDAIEVRLKEPMPNAGKQVANYGTLTGTIKVDPYVQNGWLLGMYVMEDGTIDAGM